MVTIGVMPQCFARHKKVQVEKILYIPHDNRPISDKQTAEVAERLGYEVVVPPDDLLGNRENLGYPGALWDWLTINAPEAKAAVISADSMLYGSLVGSRKHEYNQDEVLERVHKFSEFRQKNQKLPLYVFSSIMRTPRSGEASGSEEPAYYRSYGADIFRYTELSDKEELKRLSYREQKEKAFLQELIPRKDLQDWLGRREKNFAANEELIKLTRKKVFDYLALGRDDNAPYSQTHKESRHLAEAGKDLDKNQFQAMAGIDEAGMLLLARAVNTLQKKVPLVYAKYNWGRGGETIPAYSDERISASIDSAITAAGGKPVKRPEGADLVLMVNTNPNGNTYEANDWSNDGEAREGTKYFAELIGEYVAKGYKVGVADIAYANGSDNALMEQLKNRKLLFKIKAYASWNTPTNSTGFAIGAGMLASGMKEEDVKALLLTRYLDDWAYQANVRNTIARQLSWLRGDGVYGSLDTKREAVSQRTQKMMERFASKNLPSFSKNETIRVDFPWNRMFEADIQCKERKEVHFFK
ncbi:DUF4127 family protein [Selenomonas ruminantium]|nr:DUF4127 family protein [Selenomonas ruminantium]